MEYRALGRTGVQVSRLCLGSMMFGAWGNRDTDLSVRMIHTALDHGVNFIDTADLYGQGESEEIVGKALAAGRRDDVVIATKFSFPMGDDPNQRGTSRRCDHAGRRGVTAPPRHRLDRPVPDAPVGPRGGSRGDARRPGRPGAPGQGPADRVLDTAPGTDRGEPVDRAGAPVDAIHVRAAAVLAARPRHRGRRPAHLCPVQPGRAGMEPAGRGLAVGQVAQGRGRPAVAAAEVAASPLRPRAAGEPGETRGRGRVRGARRGDRHLADHLALAFVLNHPAVTAAIAGPRTMEQLESQLGATDVKLDDAALDRIDEIVAPGRTVNSVDDVGMRTPPSAPAVLRGRR